MVIGIAGIVQATSMNSRPNSPPQLSILARGGYCCLCVVLCFTFLRKDSFIRGGVSGSTICREPLDQYRKFGSLTIILRIISMLFSITSVHDNSFYMVRTPKNIMRDLLLITELFLL
jgi:hypothetical protein